MAQLLPSLPSKQFLVQYEAGCLTPLLECTDEKLRIFVEGQNDDLLHFDGGEFYQWLKECEGMALFTGI